MFKHRWLEYIFLALSSFALFLLSGCASKNILDGIPKKAMITTTLNSVSIPMSEETTKISQTPALLEDKSDNEYTVGWDVRFVGKKVDVSIEPQMVSLYLDIQDKDGSEDFYIGNYYGNFYDSGTKYPYVPDDAILNGHIWYSGLGNHFYCVMEDGNIVVYEEELDDWSSSLFNEVGRVYLGENITIHTKEMTVSDLTE